MSGSAFAGCIARLCEMALGRGARQAKSVRDTSLNIPPAAPRAPFLYRPVEHSTHVMRLWRWAADRQDAQANTRNHSFELGACSELLPQIANVVAHRVSADA